MPEAIGQPGDSSVRAKPAAADHYACFIRLFRSEGPCVTGRCQVVCKDCGDSRRLQKGYGGPAKGVLPGPSRGPRRELWRTINHTLFRLEDDRGMGHPRRSSV